MDETSSDLLVDSTGATVVAKFAKQPHFASFQLANVLDELIDTVSHCTTRSLVLDLKDIGYLDSASFGELARVKSKIEGIGGRIALCNVTDSMREILELTRLDQLFPIFDDRESALTALSQSA